jgi:hypothetical protein
MDEKGAFSFGFSVYHTKKHKKRATDGGKFMIYPYLCAIFWDSSHEVGNRIK